MLSKTFQLKSPGVQSHIEKCPTFVSKDKRPKVFGHRNKKTVQLQGHHFEIKHYTELTHCNHSQQMIWGIGPQGYKCSCKYSVNISIAQYVSIIRYGTVQSFDLKQKSNFVLKLHNFLIRFSFQQFRISFLFCRVKK